MMLLFIKFQGALPYEDDMSERFDPSNYTSDEDGNRSDRDEDSNRSEWDDDERKQGYGHVYSRQVYSVDADINQDEELEDEVDNPERAPVNPNDQSFPNSVNEDLNPDDITTLNDNVADIQTKLLAIPKFEKFKDIMLHGHGSHLSPKH